MMAGSKKRPKNNGGAATSSNTRTGGGKRSDLKEVKRSKSLGGVPAQLLPQSIAGPPGDNPKSPCLVARVTRPSRLNPSTPLPPRVRFSLSPLSNDEERTLRDTTGLQMRLSFDDGVDDSPQEEHMQIDVLPELDISNWPCLGAARSLGSGAELDNDERPNLLPPVWPCIAKLQDEALQQTAKEAKKALSTHDLRTLTGICLHYKSRAADRDEGAQLNC